MLQPIKINSSYIRKGHNKNKKSTHHNKILSMIDIATDFNLADVEEAQ